MQGFPEEAVFLRLSLFHDHVAEAVWGAFKRCLAALAHYPAPYMRTRRNSMYDFIAHEVRERFEGLEGVKVIESDHEQLYVVFAATAEIDSMVLRFKHLDDHRLPRNYPTRRAVAFDGELPLRGVPKFRVTVGYRLNDAETDIKDVSVMRLKGDRIIWYYDLAAPGSDRVTELPKQPILPGALTTKRPGRVRAKASVVVRKKKGKDDPSK